MGILPLTVYNLNNVRHSLEPIPTQIRIARHTASITRQAQSNQGKFAKMGRVGREGWDAGGRRASRAPLTSLLGYSAIL